MCVPLVGPTVPAEARPAIGVLDAIREASEVSRIKRWRVVMPPAITQALAQVFLEPIKPLPIAQADERIRELAPLLARSDNKKTWGLLASHLPGWTGSQCYARWTAMGKRGGKKPLLQDQQPLDADADSSCQRTQKIVATTLRTMQ